jgi:uncharacterized tellurite resistance protein B-like protein
MFDLIKKILANKRGGVTVSVQENEEQTRIAACVLLLETAHSDNECTAEEISHVLEVMKNDFAISEEQAEELLELAYRERSQAVDLWQFTNLINQQFDRQEKMRLMEAVWRIIHVDSQLEKHEDYFAHKLATLLRLKHKDLIAAKISSSEKMSVTN